jgi:hypothetical protein
MLKNNISFHPRTLTQSRAAEASNQNRWHSKPSLSETPPVTTARLLPTLRRPETAAEPGRAQAADGRQRSLLGKPDPVNTRPTCHYEQKNGAGILGRARALAATERDQAQIQHRHTKQESDAAQARAGKPSAGHVPAADKNLAGGNGDCRRRNRTDGVPSTRSQKIRGSNKTWARKSQLLRWRPATGHTTQVNHEERGRWDRVPRDEIEKIAWWRGPARKQELQPDLDWRKMKPSPDGTDGQKL